MTLLAALPLDAATRDWLSSLGIPCPEQPGRWPTAGELRETLLALPGRSVTFRDRPDGGWDAEVADRGPGGPGWTATVWVEPPPDPSFHHPFTFEQASPALAVVILEALSRMCGPQVLYEASAGHPVLVLPGADPVATASDLAP